MKLEIKVLLTALTIGMTALFCRAGISSVTLGGTATGFSIAPSGISLSHTANSKNFTASWTSGSGNGGVGGCRVQIFTLGVWTNLSGTVNCDADASNSSFSLPADGWSGSWASVSVRLLRVSDSSVLGVFSQMINCTNNALNAGGSSSPTPSIDEDCNGSWDNYQTYSSSAQDNGNGWYASADCSGTQYTLYNCTYGGTGAGPMVSGINSYRFNKVSATCTSYPYNMTINTGGCNSVARYY